jgi:HlyD family secretion protein
MKRLLSAVALALALLPGCNNEPDSAWQGYIEGEYVFLASPYAGQLEKLYVRRGERIEAGKPVFALEQESERAARLEAQERLRVAQARLGNLKVPKRPPEIEALRAQLNQARAARTLAALQLEQAEKLFKGNFIAQTRLDEARATHVREIARVREAEAQLSNALQPLGRDAEREAAESEVDAARAALAQAVWRLEQKSVASPAAGLVHETFFVQGEWVPAGRPVVALLPPGNVRVRFYVPETVLASIQIQRPLEIRCDGCPAPIEAKVSYVSNQAEYTPPVLFSRESRAKLMFLVEARVQGTDLRPGQPVDVKLK